VTQVTVKAWEIHLVVNGGSISALKQPDNEQTGARVLAHEEEGRELNLFNSEYCSSEYVSEVSTKVLTNPLHDARAISSNRITARLHQLLPYHIGQLSPSESKLLPNALWSIRVCTCGIKNEA
jgi:hypothetical protein